MKVLRRLVWMVVFLSGWAVAASLVYVVRTPGRVVVLTKNRPGFREIYVDARGWKLGDVAGHPEIVERLIATGKLDRLSYVGTAEEVMTAATKGK